MFIRSVPLRPPWDLSLHFSCQGYSSPPRDTRPGMVKVVLRSYGRRSTRRGTLPNPPGADHIIIIILTANWNVLRSTGRLRWKLGPNHGTQAIRPVTIIACHLIMPVSQHPTKTLILSMTVRYTRRLAARSLPHLLPGKPARHSKTNIPYDISSTFPTIIMFQ